MNGLVAPKPAPTALSRWTRHAEFLVYLVPVGTISNELYDSYVRLLQSHSVIPIRSLTRPGGYAPELSPFRSFAWDGPGSIRLRFVSTTDKIETFDGEDVHASARAIGVLGICHCPTTPNLAAAYQQFVDSIRHFPGLLVQKCFAFEHQFDLRTVEECAGLNHLVMFPVYHELANGDGMDGGEVMSTVSLHLQVVLDTLCVTILMSLESTIRAAMRQVQAQANAPTTTVEMGDAAGFLLDTNIEPSNTQYQMNHANVLSPFPSREPIGSGGSSPSTRSLPATPTGERVSSGAAAPGGSGVGSLFVSAETRTRRRHLARQRKLFGDYALLLNCLPDAMEHYLSAIELLRDEERKSGGAGGDTLWLAAALEAYVFCLCQQSQDKFVVEIVEKASEAVALYSRAGVSELEISLIENIGWYYTAVTVQLSAKNGLDKVEEVVWVKRLLWELIERGAMVFSDLSPPRQVRFLIESAGMLEAVGHHRRMAFVLHEAVALLIQRWRAPVLSSPSIQSSQSQQRTQELKTAMRLETITAQRLGMVDRSKWEVTSLRWRARRLRRLQRQLRHNKPVKVTLAMAIQDVEPWLIMRFHILRQLVTMAKMLGDPALIGLYCIELLQVLTWCDEFASDTSCVESGKPVSAFRVDHAQVPFSSHFWRSNISVGGRHGLHNRAVGIHGNNFNGVYGTPPASMEIKTKRYFTMANSPSSAVSSAAATITSTIANTPRTLMSTPRQQFSAAVNAMSNKATPAISSFSHNTAHISSPSPSTTHPSLRSSSGAAAELVNGVHMDIHNTTVFSGLLGSSGVDGIKGHRDTSRGDFSFSNYDGNMAAWNLRSKVDIQRLQKSVLSILETECCVMRPTDQVKLNSFVYIHKMRVCYEAQSSPLLDTNAAMKKCGLAPSGSLEASSSCGFFYNPFESKPDHRPRNISCGSMVSDSESDDDEVELDKKTVELSFPVSELVQVEVLLSNPFGMDLDIQQISLLITHNADEVSRVVPSPSSANAEAYPSSVVLKPYEKRRVFLSVRCLRPGIFHISGCFVKVFNIKTSFRLKAPLSLVVVEPLPYLDISLVEIGHISEQSNSGEPLEGLSEMTGPTKTSTSVDTSVGDSTCMFTNEIKRCVLVVRNVGQRLVRTLHVTVRLGKAGMSLVLPSAKTVLSTSHHPDTDTEALVCETEAMVLKCLLSYQSIASLVPLKPGDQLAIPFEVSLRSPCTQSDTGYLHTLREQLHWSFLYGEQDIVTTTDASGRDCFRESQYVVTLIPLASLFVHRVDILPQSSTMSSRNTFDDKPFCTISVEISNPTETVFLLRVSSAVVHSMDTAEITPSSDVVEWDMEIGRQSSKTVVIEIPRVDAERFVQRSIADVLNECVVLTWRTYFNTSGRLLFWDGLWSAKEQELVRLQLCRSDVAFLIAPSNTEAMGQGNQIVTPGNVEDSLLGFPFRFFHPAVLAKPPHTISIKLFEPCPLTVQVMARACGDDDSIVQLGWSRVEAEVVVKSDRESDDGLLEETGDFLISGPSKRILTTDTAKAGELDNFWVWEWNLQLLFLTEGIFIASICGILVDGGEESQMPNVVTGHSTVRISCSR